MAVSNPTPPIPSLRGDAPSRRPRCALPMRNVTASRNAPGCVRGTARRGGARRAVEPGDESENPGRLAAAGRRPVSYPASAVSPHPVQQGSTKEGRLWAAGGHLSGYFLPVLGPLIVMLVKNGSPYARTQAIRALNYHLNLLIATVLAPFAIFLLVTIPIYLFLFLGWSSSAGRWGGLADRKQLEVPAHHRHRQRASPPPRNAAASVKAVRTLGPASCGAQRSWTTQGRWLLFDLAVQLARGGPGGRSLGGCCGLSGFGAVPELSTGLAGSRSSELLAGLTHLLPGVLRWACHSASWAAWRSRSTAYGGEAEDSGTDARRARAAAYGAEGRGQGPLSARRCSAVRRRGEPRCPPRAGPRYGAGGGPPSGLFNALDCGLFGLRGVGGKPFCLLPGYLL